MLGIDPSTGAAEAGSSENMACAADSLGETKRRSQNLGVTPQNKASKSKFVFLYKSYRLGIEKGSQRLEGSQRFMVEKFTYSDIYILTVNKL